MYKSMGMQSSVNPYSANYREPSDSPEPPALEVTPPAATVAPSPTRRSRRSAALIASAQISANLRDYNRSPFEGDDVEERKTSGKSRSSEVGVQKVTYSIGVCMRS